MEMESIFGLVGNGFTIVASDTSAVHIIMVHRSNEDKIMVRAQLPPANHGRAIADSKHSKADSLRSQRQCYSRCQAERSLLHVQEARGSPTILMGITG
ncbi:hypothetical protein M0R45_024798 [Rubus argutus]|uniref:Uncharacterized protein n=1 Tax=Rubus argutus TaxID=59490 RepID=A0AAW1WSK9_RUBAR